MPLLRLLLQVLVVALTVLTRRPSQGKLLEGEERGKEEKREEEEQHVQGTNTYTIYIQDAKSTHTQLFTQ